MNVQKILWCFVIILAFSAGITTASPRAFASQETAYDRVIRTKTIRCGYLPFEPYIIKDPNTKRLSGLTYDYVNEASARAGLKIDWVGEITLDQVPTALHTKHFDAFCLPFIPDTNVSKVLDFGGYLGAIPYYVYTASNRSLTDQQMLTATFVMVDGYALTEITRKNFPAAHTLSLSQTTSMAEMYDQLRYHKAEAIVNDPFSAALYARHNVNTIKRQSGEPVAALRMFLVVPKGDSSLQSLFNTLFDIDKQDNTALIKSLLTKYSLPSDALLFGDKCQTAYDNENGWKLCAKSSALPSKTQIP